MCVYLSMSVRKRLVNLKNEKRIKWRVCEVINVQSVYA